MQKNKCKRSALGVHKCSYLQNLSEPIIRRINEFLLKAFGLILTAHCDGDHEENSSQYVHDIQAFPSTILGLPTLQGRLISKHEMEKLLSQPKNVIQISENNLFYSSTNGRFGYYPNELNNGKVGGWDSTWDYNPGQGSHPLHLHFATVNGQLMLVMSHKDHHHPDVRYRHIATWTKAKRLSKTFTIEDDGYFLVPRSFIAVEGPDRTTSTTWTMTLASKKAIESIVHDVLKIGIPPSLTEADH